jgi:hypothetical protein
MFENYAYFSSFSETWLSHSFNYVEMAIERFGLNDTSKVIEIASNDGYLLQYFVNREISVLGIEPAKNIAAIATDKEIPTLVQFFDRDLARQLMVDQSKPDLVISNNVLAHVPDINNFVEGISILLTGDAVYTAEFPHILNLIREIQFDTIYHEHYTYLSLITIEKIFGKFGLRIFDVEEISTHGGSLRLYVCLDNASHALSSRVRALRNKEIDAKLNTPSVYSGFEERVIGVKNDLLNFLRNARDERKFVVAYGAAAKGNTLLNYCGIGKELIAFVVDQNPMKQGTYLPGSRIGVRKVETLEEKAPDYILILPWNLGCEIKDQLSHLRGTGTQFVTAIPQLLVD